MNNISWLVANVITFISALFLAWMTTTSNVTPTEEVIPSVTIPMVITETNRLTVTFRRFEDSVQANDAFLKSYPGAEVASFLDSQKLSEFGYKGYYAWYEKSTSTHVVLLKGAEVLTISYLDSIIPIDKTERLSRIEKYILRYLDLRKMEDDF